MSDDTEGAPTEEAAASPRGPTKTPMYSANQAARYQRQALIKSIDDDTGRKLLCYVAGKLAPIDRDDVLGLVDLLHNVHPGDKLDLLLHTPGGDVDAAEKLISMLQTAVEDGELRVIVPDFAKSAGTLMALGADQLVMSDSSELGPIDPQVWLTDGKGNDICHSVLSYLDAYKDQSDALKKDPDDPVARLMVDKFDPATVKKFAALGARARNFAENQLKKKGLNWSKIASDLMDTGRWNSHGQMIGWTDALAMGLPVVHLTQGDPQWRRYWELYCLLRLVVEDQKKIFESSYASLVLEG